MNEKKIDRQINRQIDKSSSVLNCLLGFCFKKQSTLVFGENNISNIKQNKTKHYMCFSSCILQSPINFLPRYAFLSQRRGWSSICSFSSPTLVLLLQTVPFFTTFLHNEVLLKLTSVIPINVIKILKFFFGKKILPLN